MLKDQKTVIIVGAGPAGLTAGIELLKRSSYKPIIFEKSARTGGLSRTVEYKGCFFDVGGHRFFTKSNEVDNFWEKIFFTKGENRGRPLLVKRKRYSSIFYSDSYLDYPLSLNRKTFVSLGFLPSLKVITSYLKSLIWSRKNVKNMEDFFINAFGWELYKTFFADYTKKVHGVSSDKIDPGWGGQRIKAVSLREAIKDAFPWKSSGGKTEKSLTKSFYFPRKGCGELWQELADEFVRLGGVIKTQSEVIGISFGSKSKIKTISVSEEMGVFDYKVDYLISGMPIKDFIGCINPSSFVPKKVRGIAKKLKYRSLIVVGIIVDKEQIDEKMHIWVKKNLRKDQWIYIQDKKYKLARIQVYTNWSSEMSDSRSKVVIGLEYFCDNNDAFWSKSDSDIKEFALKEISEMKFLNKNAVIDYMIIREEKAYPLYIGAYKKLKTIQRYFDSIKNMMVIGRNGMHKWNNMDHSVLSGMKAVDVIMDNGSNKKDLWLINSDKEYQES